MDELDPETLPAGQPPGPLDRWAAFLGTTVCAASLGLVALADFGWSNVWLALVVVALAVVGAAILWHPPIRLPPRIPSRSTFLGAAVLAVAVALIAPGSENVAGPRDPAAYVASGFAIARGGSTIIHDPGLRLLGENVDPAHVDAWLYRNAINGARIRFPAQLFVRDVESPTVESAFLPLLPVWIALAARLGGVEPALHVAGIFGMLALAFVMLASRAATMSADEDGTPVWPLVGAILAVSFSQIWWAREPMAESALGAFAWLAGWAGVRWFQQGGWRWAALGALGAVCGLFTRADGVLLAAALALLLPLCTAPGRKTLFAVLVVGVAAAGLHDALVATIYTTTVYGGFTLSRAAIGVIGVGVVGGTIVAAPAVWRRMVADGAKSPLLARARTIRRVAVLTLLGVAVATVLSGVAPGVGRAAGLGAASPLAWLPGYMPWPILSLAALGVAVWGWNSVPRSVVPLLLVGGLPALLYLPDPLVTGDHPWMVRRLVPAVIPLLAIAASVGARALWQISLPDRLRRLNPAGPIGAAILVGLGLGLAVAQDKDVVGPRHGAGVVSGLTALAAELPPDAVVVFPGNQAGIHLAMPLDMVLGIDSFAIPTRTLTPEIALGLARMERAGRAVYWAEEENRQPIPREEATARVERTARVRYQVADNGPVAPPLQLRDVDHVITLYRLNFPATKS